MTKLQFIDQLAEKSIFTKTEAEKILNAFLDSVEDGLFKDSKVSIGGFGVFKTQEKAAREIISPSTGAPITIEPHKAVIFHLSENIKKIIKGQTK